MQIYYIFYWFRRDELWNYLVFGKVVHPLETFWDILWVVTVNGEAFFSLSANISESRRSPHSRLWHGGEDLLDLRCGKHRQAPQTGTHVPFLLF